MNNARLHVPKPVNEPIKAYLAGSEDRKNLQATILALKEKSIDIPMTIGGKKVFTSKKVNMHPPYELSTTLGTYSEGDAEHVKQAIDAALEAKKGWELMPWNDRAAIFLKAADLITGPYRHKMNAATMLAQSKNIYQSEIDAVCELADFLRFNVAFAIEIYDIQPESERGIWNQLEYRALEGFIYALTPFNFTAIAGNLCAAPALMGNTIVWKPAESQIYSAQVIMEVFEAAGLPPGVINLIFVDGPTAGDVVFSHRDFAGLHFTGSTGVFRTLWKNIANNLPNYKSYPRIVGETGGKDFVLAHSSAEPKEVSTALIRGAYEFQGQKCSAASRAYIPQSLWPEIKELMISDLNQIKMGSPETFSNFVNAVIDKKAYDKIKGYIEYVKNDSECEVIFGGGCDDSKGYFIEPTLVVTTNPVSKTMVEEIFGPVLTVYVYEETDWDDVIHLVDTSTEYALTGAIFAKDREIVNSLTDKLRHAAGNFYINDKPTGAVVGQQPFGGARGSGTNDKAGSVLNLFRWVSARTIKENFNPPTDFRYPFLED